MDNNAVSVDWENECKRLKSIIDSGKAESEKLKCQMFHEKDMFEAKLRDAERTIQILQEHQREDKAKINELSVYKRVYEDVFAKAVIKRC